MNNILATEHKKEIRLTLTDTVTIQDINEVKKILLELAGKNKPVILDVTGLTDTDFSLIQLVASFYSSFKNITITGKRTGLFWDMVRILGMDRAVPVVEE